MEKEPHSLILTPYYGKRKGRKSLRIRKGTYTAKLVEVCLNLNKEELEGKGYAQIINYYSKKIGELYPEKEYDYEKIKNAAKKLHKKGFFDYVRPVPIAPFEKKE